MKKCDECSANPIVKDNIEENLDVTFDEMEYE